jgi:EAL domain-containing protein (putative c-di-GMP-specific phosphodiesterase class I)
VLGRHCPLSDGCSYNKLIARADAAMYSAKRSGGSTHCFYSPAMDADAERQFDLLRDLRKALHNKEMELFYQPKVEVKSGKITATEALLRWKHPTRGIILPSVFIPIAERFGLIGAIGNWVIEDACRQSRAWRDKGLRMRVAINLSAHQMRQEDIVERITEALQRHRIHPSLLTCEITETAAMEDTEGDAGDLPPARRARHPPLDRRFRHRLLEPQLPAQAPGRGAEDRPQLHHGPGAQRRRPRRRRRRRSSCAMRSASGSSPKGVENQRQQQILVDMACDELQGFLFAKPMSARALQLWAINDRDRSRGFPAVALRRNPAVRARLSRLAGAPRSRGAACGRPSPLRAADPRKSRFVACALVAFRPVPRVRPDAAPGAAEPEEWKS